MDTCTAEFARLTAEMPGLDCDANPFVTLTNPLTLQHWTLPIIELTLVAGAIACLIHALRWRRLHGDSSNLVLWLASVVSLLVIEPFTYFPQWFGLEDALGVTFVHNQFTVQLLYDRLPLYIVAMYPAFSYAAWVLVQRTGIRERCGKAIAAVSITFVFYALYEVIDMVGPQFRWWVWNEDLSTSVPTFAHVPLLNMQAFSIALPFAMSLLTMVVSAPGRAGGWSVVRNVALVSILVWPFLFVSSLPSLLLTLSGVPLETSRAVATWVLVVIVAVVATAAFVGAYLNRRRDPTLVPDGVTRDYLGGCLVIVYLAVAAATWVAALPEYWASSSGFTSSGGRTGSLPFAITMAAVSIALTVGAYARTVDQSGSGAGADRPK